MKSIILLLITVYQRTISPDHGWPSLYKKAGTCKYFPSCSEYSYQAVERYGVCRGIIKGIWRIFRCNPLSSGGVDIP